MDNKQDRQLYWEVKQFLHGTPNTAPPPVKTASLRDVAASVMNENKPFSQAKPQSHSNVFDATGSMLDAMKSLEAKNNPGHIAYTKNGSTNPFTLNEAQSKKDRDTIIAAEYTRNMPELGTIDSPTSPADGYLRSGLSDLAIDLRQPRLDTNKELNTAIAAQREENRYRSRPDAYVPMGDIKGRDGKVIPSLSAQANAPQAPYQPAVPYDQQTDRPTPARTDRIPVKTPGTPAPTAAAPGTAPATPAPTSAAPGTAPVTPAPTGTASPSRVPAKNTPYVRTYTSSEPTSTNAPNDNTYLPNRSDNGARVFNPRAADDKASDNPEMYQGMDDSYKPLGLPKQTNTIGVPKFASSNTSMGNRTSNRTSGGPSAGQYRGSSNMGMAPGPQRQEKLTLQSVMAQQNQKATSDSLGQMTKQNTKPTADTLGQMGAVQNTPATPSSGFQGSVLPPMNSLGSPRTNKTNEFKYSSGSRLS
jgi:hypothetical protein